MMLATPVIYPLSRLPQLARDWSFLNPMAAVVENYRACFKGGPFDWPMLALSFLTAAAYFVFGLWFFRKRESKLADIL
jgi:lipopolysaccharide transport system permease protein